MHGGQLLLRQRQRLQLDNRVNLGERISRITPQIQQRKALSNFGGAEALGRKGEYAIPIGCLHPPSGLPTEFLPPQNQPRASDQTISATIKEQKPGTTGTAFPAVPLLVSHQHTVYHSV